MAQRIIIFILLGSYVFYSCDPLRRINMKNTSSDTAVITWVATDDSIGFNPFVLNSSKELKFTLPPGVHNEIKLSFGNGGWTRDNIQYLMKYLASLQIQSAHHQSTFTTPGEISDYLWLHRKGLGNKRIEITISQ